jgi:DNA-binding CsgD family transcriptional regulator
MNINSLTRIERIVFDQLVLGKSNKEIGNAIMLSEAGVKNHVTHIFHQLGCRTRAEVIAAYYLGVIDALVKQSQSQVGCSETSFAAADQTLLPLSAL